MGFSTILARWAVLVIYIILYRDHPSRPQRPCLLAFREHDYDQVQYDTEVDVRTKHKFVCPPMEQLMQLEGAVICLVRPCHVLSRNKQRLSRILAY